MLINSLTELVLFSVVNCLPMFFFVFIELHTLSTMCSPIWFVLVSNHKPSSLTCYSFVLQLFRMDSLLYLLVYPQRPLLTTKTIELVCSLLSYFLLYTSMFMLCLLLCVFSLFCSPRPKKSRFVLLCFICTNLLDEDAQSLMLWIR